MKKFFISFALFAALVFVVSCGGGGSKTGDNTDTGDTVTDEDTVDTDPATDTDSPSDTAPSNSDTEPSDDPTTDPAEQTEEGIYLGIIGFNYKLNPRPIEILTKNNMTDFQDFIDDFEMDDGTALYFADYTALGMMRDYTPVPPKLQNVALVTFTDGEDTSSDGPTNDPENYNDPDVYLNAIHNKIVTNGIHGLSVEAYSIGLRSGDTGSDFKSRLEKLASSSDNAFEVSNMEEVQERFTEIAENLYYVFKTIDIDFKVLGNYSDGTRMRFTFDISCDHDENVCEKNGINSNLYIDATYRRSGSERSFENFAYHGFSGNLTTVKCGERDEKGFYPCKFENLQYDNMDTEIKQIELWKSDNSEWKHENEALKQEDSKVNESKSSALIMLVLDCTTSLGNSKFEKLKEAGKDFIETLVNGGSGVTEDDPTTPADPCNPNPCTCISNSNGNCTVSGTSYVCGCNSGYTWNGWQCASTATPCNPNPCTSISNSTGVCTVSGSSYICGCQWGYDWNGSQCVQPSTPCNPNPCTSIANSTGGCVIKETSYVCVCNSGYTWNGSTCASNGSSTLPECSSTSSTPCKDSSTGYIWSARASSTMTWSNAGTYCDNLTEGGYSDWHLPTIDELKTLLIANRVTSNCQVSETNGCLSSSCWSCSTCTQTGTQSSSVTGCSSWGSSYSDGRYSKLGDGAVYLWSSSTLSDSTDDAWCVSFYYGGVGSLNKTNYTSVRCVR